MHTKQTTDSARQPGQDDRKEVLTVTTKQNTVRFCIVEYIDGKFSAVISGCGRNRGKWDSSAESRRTAQRWAKEMRTKYPSRTYRIEETV